MNKYKIMLTGNLINPFAREGKGVFIPAQFP